MRAVVLMLVVLLCLPSASLLAQGGKLQQVREEVRKKPTPKDSEDDEESTTPQWDCDDDDSGFGLILADGVLTGLRMVCVTTVYGLYRMPALALGDDKSRIGYFARYPYGSGQAGYMWLEDPTPGDLPAASSEIEVDWRGIESPVSEDDGLPEGVRLWSGRFFLEGSQDFDGLTRFNGQLLLEASNRLGVQTSTSYLRERLADGQHDELYLGDANFTFRFAQTEQVQLRTGIGFRWMTDRDDSAFGVNFLYGGEFFPVKPIIGSGFIELGNLGSAFVIHTRATVGVNLSRWEFYTGYDWLRIGSVDLHGPVLGLRLWF